MGTQGLRNQPRLLRQQNKGMRTLSTVNSFLLVNNLPVRILSSSHSQLTWNRTIIVSTAVIASLSHQPLWVGLHKWVCNCPLHLTPVLSAARVVLLSYTGTGFSQVIDCISCSLPPTDFPGLMGKIQPVLSLTSSPSTSCSLLSLQLHWSLCCFSTMARAWCLHRTLGTISAGYLHCPISVNLQIETWRPSKIK